MTIEQLLDTYISKKTGVEGFFEQVMLNSKLSRDLSNLAVKYPGWRWVKLLVEKEAGRKGINPFSFISICHKLGINTADQLVEYVQANDKININNLEDVLFPQLDVPQTLSTISPAQLRREITAKLKQLQPQPNFKSLRWHFTDSIYLVPTEHEIQQLQQISPTLHYRYIKQRRDCDDFANILKAWLATCGYGNLSIAYVEVMQFHNNRVTSAHAINLLYYTKSDTTVIEYFEPQTGWIWALDKPEPHFNIEYQLPYRIRF